MNDFNLIGKIMRAEALYEQLISDLYLPRISCYYLGDVNYLFRNFTKKELIPFYKNLQSHIPTISGDAAGLQQSIIQTYQHLMEKINFTATKHDIHELFYYNSNWEYLLIRLCYARVIIDKMNETYYNRVNNVLNALKDIPEVAPPPPSYELTHHLYDPDQCPPPSYESTLHLYYPDQCPPPSYESTLHLYDPDQCHMQEEKCIVKLDLNYGAEYGKWVAKYNTASSDVASEHETKSICSNEDKQIVAKKSHSKKITPPLPWSERAIAHQVTKSNISR